MPPACTVTFPVMVPVPPSAAADWTVTGLPVVVPLIRRVPALTVVAPVWVDAPASVQMPVPLLVTAVVPVLLTMLPEKVASVLRPPTFQVTVRPAVGPPPMPVVASPVSSPILRVGLVFATLK